MSAQGVDEHMINVHYYYVSLAMRDKVTRQCPQITNFEEKGEPKVESNRGPSAYQPRERLTARPIWFTRGLRNGYPCVFIAFKHVALFLFFTPDVLNCRTNYKCGFTTFFQSC